MGIDRVIQGCQGLGFRGSSDPCALVERGGARVLMHPFMASQRHAICRLSHMRCD